MSLACQFVLEVLGGAGAIWGCAELARLRKGGSSHPSWDLFSYAALVVGICCLFRFLLIHCCCSQNGQREDDIEDDDRLVVQEKHGQSLSWLEEASVVAKDPRSEEHTSEL